MIILGPPWSRAQTGTAEHSGYLAYSQTFQRPHIFFERSSKHELHMYQMTLLNFDLKSDLYNVQSEPDKFEVILYFFVNYDKWKSKGPVA